MLSYGLRATEPPNECERPGHVQISAGLACSLVLRQSVLNKSALNELTTNECPADGQRRRRAKNTARDHTGEVGAREVGTFDEDIHEVGAVEVGTGEVGTVELGADEVGGKKVGAGEIGIGEVGAAEGGAGKVGAREISIEQQGAGEIGVVELGTREIEVREVGVGDVGAAKVDPAEVRIGAHHRGADGATINNCSGERSGTTVVAGGGGNHDHRGTHRKNTHNRRGHHDATATPTGGSGKRLRFHQRKLPRKPKTQLRKMPTGFCPECPPIREMVSSGILRHGGLEIDGVASIGGVESGCRTP